MKSIILLLATFVLFAFDVNSQTVYTCKGGAVSAMQFSEFSQQQIQALNTQTQNDYGYLGITVIGDASNQYNCHSYAWHLREGNSNRVWINNAGAQINGCYVQTHNIDRYWTDGCFIQVCNEADADKVHYYCGDHSAAASTSNPGMWESKWGQLSVVRHTRTGVPYADPTNSVNFYASTTITGDYSSLCSGNRTFSVKNISGASYSWSYSGGLSPVGSSNTSTFTVQRNGNMDGANWVEVQISTACSNAPVTRRVDFSVGIPPINWVSFSNAVGGEGFWCSTHYGNLFSVEPNYQGMIYEARLLSWPSMTVVRTNNNAVAGSDPFSYVPTGWYVFQLRPAYSCSGAPWFETEIEYADCLNGGGEHDFRLLASPNPTNGDLNVKILDEKQAVKKLSTTEKVKYQLYNLTRTQLIKQWIFDNTLNQQKLNLVGVKPGQYVLVVSKGKYRQSTQIIVK